MIRSAILTSMMIPLNLHSAKWSEERSRWSCQRSRRRYREQYMSEPYLATGEKKRRRRALAREIGNQPWVLVDGVGVIYLIKIIRVSLIESIKSSYYLCNFQGGTIRPKNSFCDRCNFMPKWCKSGQLRFLLKPHWFQCTMRKKKQGTFPHCCIETTVVSKWIRRVNFFLL